MHIKWDVPKGFVHRFRDCFSVFFIVPKCTLFDTNKKHRGFINPGAGNSIQFGVDRLCGFTFTPPAFL